MTPVILSTRKLEPNQKALVLNSGLGLVEQNFISVIPLDFKVRSLKENIIFTSRNAVNIVLQVMGKEKLRQKKIFCVGEKTTRFMKREGFKVAESGDYGIDLAKKILQKYPGEEFLFFCGRRRRRELPDFLKRNKIPLEEIEVYDTLPFEHKITRNFDGILFFSPSAVRSYCSRNELGETVVFCIGKTTAREAKRFTQRIITARKPSVENVIVQAVKHFK